jgi:hypothetical protein
MIMFVDCPDCGLPATVESRGEVQGTAGGVELLYLRCVIRHWFLAPADRLGLESVPPPVPDARRQPLRGLAG